MITSKSIAKLQPKDKRYTVKIDKSLYLRVTSTGFKSFVFRYCSYGKVKDITLGTFPDMSPQLAIQAAHIKRQDLELTPSKGVTLSFIFRIWRRQKKGLKCFQTEKRRIKNHLISQLGKQEIDKFTIPQIYTYLMTFKNTPQTLRFLLLRFKEMMGMAVRLGYLKYNAFSELKFRDFVPHYKPKRRPSIPASKLSDFFNELNVQKAPNWLRYYMLFCVYALLRPKEASRVKRCFVVDDVLTLPESEMKEGNAHRIPLCPEMLKLLELVKKEAMLKVQKHNARLRKDQTKKRLGRFIWSFGHHLRPIGKQYMAKWIRGTSFCGKLCAHGFRSIGRDWLKDAGVAYEVCEDALSHVVGSQASRRYISTDYLKSRIPAMQKWWNYIYSAYCATCAPIPELST